MLTVETLCSQMEASGRPFSKRNARAWRNKGLLPHMTQHGLGHGAGSEAFWSDPRVFERARIAYDLLALHSRADVARLSLWLLGYDIAFNRIRADYGTIIRRHFRSMLDVGGKSRADNVGRIASTFGRHQSKEFAAPFDVRQTITDCALPFLEVFYGTDSEFAAEGLAEKWRNVYPWTLGPPGQPDGPTDEALTIFADWLGGFASLPMQREMVRTATDYELMRARRLLRFLVGFYRRFDPSVDCRDDIESLGGWTLVVLCRFAVPILIAVLRQDTIRHEFLPWLLEAAQRLRKVRRLDLLEFEAC